MTHLNDAKTLAQAERIRRENLLLAIHHFPRFEKPSQENLEQQLRAIRIIGCWIPTVKSSDWLSDRDPLVNAAKKILSIEQRKGEKGVTKEIAKFLKPFKPLKRGKWATAPASSFVPTPFR